MKKEDHKLIEETTWETEELFDADPDCDHEVVSLWSGVKCKKCSGWFCY